MAVQTDEPRRYVQDHVTRLHSEQLEFTQSIIIFVFLDDLFSSSSSMDKRIRWEENWRVIRVLLQ